MGQFVLENEELRIAVNSFGAELCQITDVKTKKEYLWNADEKYWKRYSPVLFPFVGSLKDKRYIYDGKEYAMGQHGFARDMDFVCSNQTDNEIWFTLESNEETLQKYPFAFRLNIGYRLVGRTIKVMWRVENTDTKEMYFSIGAHPAFYCPINEGEKQSDCYIQTDCKDKITYYKITSDGLKDSSTESTVAVDEDGIFPITETMFDEDALIIENEQIHELALLDSNKKPYVRLNFDMELCGIWSPAKKNAPFVCLEPWSGRCDNAAFDGTLEEREYGHSLKSKECFEKGYDITIL